MVAQDPLHRSERAAFPHSAVASGDDAKPPQEMGMTDPRGRQPVGKEALHRNPRDTATLAPPRQGAIPEPGHRPAALLQRRTGHGHAKILSVPPNDRLQPLSDLGNGRMQPTSEFRFHVLQLRLQPLTTRLPQHGEASVTPFRPTDVGEPEERARFRLALSPPLTVRGRIGPKLQQPGLLRVQCQPDLPQARGQLRPTPLGIRFVLESQQDVIGIPHDEHLAVRMLLTPPLNPAINDVVEIDIHQQGRGTAALRRAFLHRSSPPRFQHASVQPFLDESHDTPVRNPALDELDQPPVVMASKNPRMSTSSTPFTLLVSTPA